MIRKKTLRLLLYDYQRTARCYTIYGTFKSWLSDDFTTIPAGTLRLLLALIGYRAKARKKCGESRQRFRAARRWSCTGGDADPSAGAPGAALARDPHTVEADRRRACMVCDLLHCLAWIHNRRRALYTLL